MKKPLAKIAGGLLVLEMAASFYVRRAPQRNGTIEIITNVSSAWFLAIIILLISIPYAFGSKETLARNSKLIGTQNLVAARIVSVIGVLVGCVMVLVAVGFTYYYTNAIFSAGGLLTTLVIAFLAYGHARADVAKIAKANEDGLRKN